MSRVATTSILGAASAWLWLWLSTQWAIHIEFSALFPALYHATGTNGPWMVGVGNTIFAVTSALFFALFMALLVKDMWWRLSVIFVLLFCVGHIVLGVFFGNPISFLVTYTPFWLFIASFMLCSSIFSRRWPNQALKTDAPKDGARLS